MESTCCLLSGPGASAAELRAAADVPPREVVRARQALAEQVPWSLCHLDVLEAKSVVIFPWHPASCSQQRGHVWTHVDMLLGEADSAPKRRPPFLAPGLWCAQRLVSRMLTDCFLPSSSVPREILQEIQRLRLEHEQASQATPERAQQNPTLLAELRLLRYEGSRPWGC